MGQRVCCWLVRCGVQAAGHLKHDLSSGEPVWHLPLHVLSANAACVAVQAALGDLRQAHVSRTLQVVPRMVLHTATAEAAAVQVRACRGSGW